MNQFPFLRPKMLPCFWLKTFLNILFTFPGCPISVPLLFSLGCWPFCIIRKAACHLPVVTFLFIMSLNCRFYWQTYVLPQELILNQLKSINHTVINRGMFPILGNNHSHMFQLIFPPPHTHQIAYLFLAITGFWVLCVAWARPCGYTLFPSRISQYFFQSQGFLAGILVNILYTSSPLQSNVIKQLILTPGW